MAVTHAMILPEFNGAGTTIFNVILFSEDGFLHETLALFLLRTTLIVPHNVRIVIQYVA